MKLAWDTARGLFWKEWKLQLGHWLVVLNRMLIGPLIALVTTALLYGSFFGLYPQTALGEVNAKTYQGFIVFGFLGHMFLNAGYHSFSAKLVAEWSNRTLPLLWLSSCSRISLLASLLSVEIVRCAILLFLGFLWLGVPASHGCYKLLAEVILLYLVFAFGAFLGTVRAALVVTHLGRAELLDNFYLIFVFTSCPYIPGLALPRFLQGVIHLNPLLYGLQSLRQVWLWESPWAPLGFFVLGSGVCVLVSCTALWLLRYRIRESAFS